MSKKYTPFPVFFRQIRTLPSLDALQANSISLVGFPYDEGTRLNNGRVGGNSFN